MPLLRVDLIGQNERLGFMLPRILVHPLEQVAEDDLVGRVRIRVALSLAADVHPTQHDARP